jgi:membrane-associated phospholipid phosphatase
MSIYQLNQRLQTCQQLLKQSWFASNKRWLIVLIGLFIGYTIINRLPREVYIKSVSQIDVLFPTLSWFTIPYLGFIAWLAYGVWLTQSSPKVSIHLRWLVMTNLLGIVIHFLLPTHIERPLIGDELHLSSMLKLVYWLDMPYSVFPSLHVANTFVLSSLYCKHHQTRSWAWLWAVWAVLVTLSVLFTKQHSVSDAASGALLAWLSAKAVVQWRRLARP